MISKGQDAETVDRIDSTDEDSEQRLIEENGANKSIKLRDGRMTAEEDESPLQIQVWPVLGERTLYYVRLRTSHYSFCLKNSCVIRDISEFYQLRSILTTENTYMTIPSLPLQPMLWVSSYKTISNSMAYFLSEIIKQRELLSNKAVHLFLQSTLSISAIQENVEGRRDDEVAMDPRHVFTDDRKVAREGFGSLFGGGGGIDRN